MPESMSSPSKRPIIAAFNENPGVSDDGDPFNVTPTNRAQSHRYSSFDGKLFSDHIKGSPSQAKRALEAHIVDTDRRIQDTSRLGTSLVDQKKQLAARLKEVEEQQGNDGIGSDLSRKLAELEKEVNETSRESARAFLPKLRISLGENNDAELTSTGIGQAKMQALSTRKQRNQPSDRAKDVQFAAEISTSLLEQVKSLQTLLAEKEDALKRSNQECAQLQMDVANFNHRLRSVDDNEQKYKDENWNLETQVQDLTVHIKELATREHRLTQALASTKDDKSIVEREQDELRQAHNKLSDEHAALRRQHDIDLSGLHRDLEDGDGERDNLQRKIEELTSQNQDLAKVVAYRVHHESEPGYAEMATSSETISADRSTPDNSPPPSPTKATPRHGALESETLRSSLTHAHRMIQNLKNNIHREKTEKVELKRMLQDARDDVEARRSESGMAAANPGKMRTKPVQYVPKKATVSRKLGDIRNSSDEIIEDPSWEDHDGSPTRQRPTKAGLSDLNGTDSSDAFATADERNSTATDTDAFETGAESLGDSEGDVTETEGSQVNHLATLPRGVGNRNSYQSTASDDELNDLTPPSSQPKYKLKLGRGGFGRSNDTLTRGSPASFASNRSQSGAGQNLAAELEDLDDASVAGSTPSKASLSREQTPDLFRQDTRVRTTPLSKSKMVDSGMVTEPWQRSIKATDVVKDSVIGELAMQSSSPVHVHPVKEPVQREEPAKALSMSNVYSQSTTPVSVKQIPSTSIAASSIAPAQRPTSARDSSDVSTSFDKDSNLVPSTQALLSDLIHRAHTRSTSGGTTVAQPSPRGVGGPSSGDTIASAGKPESPFTISIEGRETRPRKSPGSADSVSSDQLQPNKSLMSSVLEQHSPAERISSSPKDGREPTLLISRDENNSGEFQEPTLQFDNSFEGNDGLPKSFPSDTTASFRPTSSILARDPTAFPHTTPPATSHGMTDEGTQTTISSDHMEKIMRAQNRKSLPGASVGNVNSLSPSTTSSPTGRSLSMGTSIDQSSVKALRRPASATGPRVRPGSPPPPAMPPLPADHKEVIAAASRTSSILGSMPPPTAPASASRLVQEKQRPRTPSGTFSQVNIKGTPTPTLRNRTSSMAARSDNMSRRSSVSSFASELDERFNISASSNSNIVGGSNRNTMNFDSYDSPGTDPRMILAITQTMIGEFLWKYTRKAGRENHSEKRHKRFFWIHPYTRTLYWSNHDPSSAGRAEHHAKSVSIEAVRVIADDNPIPPGLHPKSIVVLTPGRSIKFTAPTSQRHETWFNALTYLLLRNTPEQQQQGLDGDPLNYSNTTTLPERSNTLSSLTSDEISEFNPTLAQPYSRTASRMSRASFGSSKASNRVSGTGGAAFNSPISKPASSPQGTSTVPSLALRQSQAAQKRTSSVTGTFPASSSSPLAQSIPLPRLSEADRSRNPSRYPLRETDGNAGSSRDGEQPAVAGAIQPSEGDGDKNEGFKKPRRPMSLSNRSAKENNSTSSLTSTGAAGGGKSGGGGGGGGAGGKLSSLTSRLRPPSFASLKSRRKGGERSSASLVGGSSDGRTAPAPSPVVSDEPDRGRQPSHTHTHGGGGDGAVENVRACCDGKHDVGSLHHRSNSRARSISSRPSSRNLGLGGSGAASSIRS